MEDYLSIIKLKVLPKYGYKNQLEDALLNVLDNPDDYLSWVKEIAKYHISKRTGSEFWINAAKERKITVNKINKSKTMDELLDLMGDADYDELKQELGYEKLFLPKGMKSEKLYRSDSSGTTGPAKTVYHAITPLAFSAANEYVGIISNTSAEDLKDKKLLALGPKGAYQEEHKILADFLGMEYIDLSFETKGLKNLPPAKLMEILGPIIYNTKELLKEKNVGLMTGSGEMIPFIDRDLLKNVKVIKLSGTGMNGAYIDKLRKEVNRNIIPSYGHFSGKSSIGFLDENNLDYYPTFPFTNYIVSNENGESKEKMVIAQPELFLIHDEDIVSVSPENPSFKGIKGIRNPHR